MNRKLFITLGVALFICQEVLAGGMTITGTISNHSGGAAPSYRVECWDGGGTTNKTGPNYITAGTLSTFAPNPSATDGSSKINLYDPRSNKSVKVRIWEGSDPATIIAAKGYYGYGSYSIGDVSAPPGNTVLNIKTDVKADAPETVTLTAGGYNLKWDDVKQTYLVSFNLNAGVGGWKTEAPAYKIYIKKPGEATWKYDHDGAGWTITETDVNNPYFVGGGTYTAKASATNDFGTTWSPDTAVNIPTGGPGGGGVVSYDLIKKDAGLGVNSIGIPFDAPMTFVSSDGATSVAVSTLQDLIDAIGKTGVTATAYWDNSSQQLTGNTYDPAGTSTFSTAGYDPKNVTLQAGKGYYLSVGKSVSFKLKK